LPLFRQLPTADKGDLRRRERGRFSMHDTVGGRTAGEIRTFGVTLCFVVAKQATDAEWPLRWLIDAGAP
jgi:hypothetical protein